jgi:hypothetical protein
VLRIGGRLGLCLGLSLGLAVGLAACRDGGVEGAGPPPATDPPPGEVPTSAIPPPLRSATGAVGGTPDDRIGPPGDAQPFQIPLAGGECYNELLDGTVDPPAHRFEVVDCNQPHDAEVYSAMALVAPLGAPFPGEQAVTREANRWCLIEFEPYVGREYARSELRLGTMRPVTTTWSTGDRTVVCSLYDAELRPLVGSVRGSAR